MFDVLKVNSKGQVIGRVYSDPSEQNANKFKSTLVGRMRPSEFKAGYNYIVKPREVDHEG